MAANVIGVFHFFFLQVKHHDAEAAGYVCQVVVEIDSVDALVAHDVFVLDVAHVAHVAIGIDEVDVGVGVGHKEFALAFAIAHRADADIRQPIDFVDDVDGIVVCVVIKQFVFGGCIHFFPNRFNGNDFLVGQMRAPMSDGNAFLRKA